MTVTQYVTDLCLNEVEQRGELPFYEGHPIVPYASGHMVETILTRSSMPRPATGAFVSGLMSDATDKNLRQAYAAAPRPGKPKGPAFTPRKPKKGNRK
jgi:hypothetical protein